MSCSADRRRKIGNFQNDHPILARTFAVILALREGAFLARIKAIPRRLRSAE
jgi:hypothetical protein